MATFLFEGKKVYYETHGAGTPIVVLNGIMMSCASWGAFVAPFSAHNRLILLDFFDQGRSEKLVGQAYTQTLQAEVLRGLLDHLGLERARLLGISYGGEVAMQFAVLYPGRVDRLALFNTTARTGAWLGDIGDGWNLAARDAESYYLATIPIIYSPGFYQTHSDWMNKRRVLLGPVFSNPDFTGAMIRLTNSARGLDLTARLCEITASTLVVSSAEDYLTPPSVQREMVARIPNCAYAMIPDCGHASMYEQPVVFTALALGFLNSEGIGPQMA